MIYYFGDNITFAGDFSLQSKASWQKFIDKSAEEIILESQSFELYFEEESFTDFIERLESRAGIEYVHDVRKYPWARHAIRFYDPDGHTVEVGESMKSAVNAS